MQFTHKLVHNFKPKIVNRLSAVLLAVVTALSFLSTTASAWTGDNTGKADPSAYGSFPYGYKDNSNQLSWRVDLYVSASETGKIDPVNDIIDTDKLPWMGAVLLTKQNSDSFVQCDYTANRRSLVYDSVIFSDYCFDINLPHCYQMKSDLKDMTDPVFGKKVYVVRDTYKLPTDSDNIKTAALYKKHVKDVVESAEFTSKVIDAVSDFMGGDGQFLVNVINKVQGAVLTKLSNKYQEYKAGSCGFEDVMALIRPDSDECIVEWAAVVTPLVAYTEFHYGCNDGSSHNGWDCSCWEMLLWDGSGFGGSIIGNKVNGRALVMDSFWCAQYNVATRYLYTDTYLNTLESLNVYVRKASEKTTFVGSDGRTYHAHGGSVEDYREYGKLRTELYIHVRDAAIAARDTHEETRYCGIWTSRHLTDDADFNTGTSNLKTLEANMAKYGGITVYKSEIPEPGIPVYYYEYDSSDKPTGKVYTEDYKPNGKTTFTPSDKYGIPIADESTLNVASHRG